MCTHKIFPNHCSETAPKTNKQIHKQCCLVGGGVTQRHQANTQKIRNVFHFVSQQFRRATCGEGFPLFPLYWVKCSMLSAYTCCLILSVRKLKLHYLYNDVLPQTL